MAIMQTVDFGQKLLVMEAACTAQRNWLIAKFPQILKTARYCLLKRSGKKTDFI